METWNQRLDRRTREIAIDYGCTLKAASSGARCEYSDWQREVIEWLKAGGEPSQAFVNHCLDVDGRGDGYWWKRRICHDHPDIFDRLSKLGLSLYMSKTELEAGQPY